MYMDKEIEELIEKKYYEAASAKSLFNIQKLIKNYIGSTGGKL